MELGQSGLSDGRSGGAKRRMVSRLGSLQHADRALLAPSAFLVDTQIEGSLETVEWRYSWWVTPGDGTKRCARP